VASWHDFLGQGNASHTTPAAAVPKFNVFAFEFFNWNVTELGWYRLSCQNFEDPAWPALVDTSYV
jgi:hypothetical protein